MKNKKPDYITRLKQIIEESNTAATEFKQAHPNDGSSEWMHAWASILEVGYETEQRLAIAEKYLAGRCQCGCNG